MEGATERVIVQVDDAPAESRPPQRVIKYARSNKRPNYNNIQQPTGNARCDSEITLKVIVNGLNQLRDGVHCY
jgi:hypothetical protein